MRPRSASAAARSARDISAGTSVGCIAFTTCITSDASDENDGGSRLAIVSACDSASALTMSGSATVTSTFTVMKSASGAILRHDWASSNVQPERPPHCGWSIVIWMP